MGYFFVILPPLHRLQGLRSSGIAGQTRLATVDSDCPAVANEWRRVTTDINIGV